MQIITLSDTHGKHGKIEIPDGDIIIHAGDVTSMGRKHEVVAFFDWFASLKHPHKIFIPGNHDFFFEALPEYEILKWIPPGVTYLNDSGVELEGLRFWGSPITPWFNNWAFNRLPGEDIRKHWALIPAELDILITHGPPRGILDKTVGDELTGCADLLNSVRAVKPLYHIFGHIHEGYGMYKDQDTTFLNASVLDEMYQVRNQPCTFEL
ncbi:MAG: metallophosphoesterase [Sphingobacterium sp.]|uniref:metallophosphatase domain-containing protein n=1 Tax=Sphingobacterium sp. JB170 TaxID=1434842 RepID=UPI00097ED6D3|nr:metallophosphatase domain-containing protein [Sphingobacterium sp. JB170]SJN37155.1 Adult brain protein 239-like protein [Sphingobacterium sp. JB170]